MKSLQEWIMNYDAFGLEPTLKSQGKSKHSIFLGVILSYLIYGLLLAYFLSVFIDMLSSPTTTSSILNDAFYEPLDISRFRICMYSGENQIPFQPNLTEYVTANLVDDITQEMRDIELTECSNYSSPFSLCACFVNSVELKNNQHVYFYVFSQKFIDPDPKPYGAKMGVIQPHYIYELDSMDTTLKEEYRESIDTQVRWSPGAWNYFLMSFDKEIYEVDNSFWIESKNVFKGLSMTSTGSFVDNPALSEAGVTIYEAVYSGKQYTTHKIFTKFPDILGNVAGLFGTIVFVINVFFHGFFRFKFSKDKVLQNNLNKGNLLPLYNSSNSKHMPSKIANNQNSLNFMQYVYFRFLGLFGKKSVKLIAFQENLSDIEKELDVIHLVNALKTIESGPTEVRAQMKTELEDWLEKIENVKKEMEVEYHEMQKELEKELEEQEKKCENLLVSKRREGSSKKSI